MSGMVTFAAWCVTLALLAWRVPRWWQSKAEYLITDKMPIYCQDKHLVAKLWDVMQNPA